MAELHSCFRSSLRMAPARTARLGRSQAPLGGAAESDRARLAVITSAQIRQARKLLGWEPSKLARRAKVHSLIVERAESVASEPPITAYQAALMKQALVNAGVEFTNGDEPGVKLKAKGKMPRFAEPA